MDWKLILGEEFTTITKGFSMSPEETALMEELLNQWDTFTGSLLENPGDYAGNQDLLTQRIREEQENMGERMGERCTDPERLFMLRAALPILLLRYGLKVPHKSNPA